MSSVAAAWPQSPARASRALCWLLPVPLALGGLVDMPRIISLGSVTLLGGLTIAQVGLGAAGLLAVGAYPRTLLLRFAPYALFLTWMAARSFTMLTEQAPLQHGLVYAAFGLHLLLAGSLAAVRPHATTAALHYGMLAMDAVALALVAISLATGTWLVGPRAVGLLAIVAVAWHLAHWFHDRPWAGLRALLWIAVVLASLSRTALAIALVNTAIVVGLHLTTKGTRAVRAIPAIAAGVAVLLAIGISQAPVLLDRFVGGYTTVDVGGISVSTSGRSEFWPVVIESAMQHPLIGGGLGSSQAALADFDPEVVGHPHNEYLRVWHDGGAIAAVLLFAALFGWLWLLGRQWRAATRAHAPAAAVMGAGFLMLLGLLLGALTDNGFDYVFLMGPAGIVAGAALGLRPFPAAAR